MKTNPKEDADGSTWGVNFVSEHAVLAQRVKYRLNQRHDLHATVSSEPAIEKSPDLLILPVAKLMDYVERVRSGAGISAAWLPEGWMPVIVYGEPGRLKSAFDVGAADYLKNPWTIDEMLARLDRLIGLWRERQVFAWGRLSVGGGELRYEGRKVRLSQQENPILRLLLRNRSRTVPRDVLFYAIWGRVPEHRSRAVDMHVAAINRKIKSLAPVPEGESVIHSVRGAGYTID